MGVMRRQLRRAAPTAGEQHRRAGIRQHEGQPLGRIVRVERQIGAAGLEDAEQPDQHLQRALDAQPHHHLGADPERAQMMRQLVGARIELAVAERSVLEHHRDRVGRRATCAANSSGSVADGTARAVSFHSRRMVWRSSAAECRGCRSRGPASATAASSSRTSRAAIASTLARSNRSVAYSSDARDPRRRAVRARAARQGSATGRTWRSRSRPARTRCVSPGSSRLTAALFCNASITWNSG